MLKKNQISIRIFRPPIADADRDVSISQTKEFQPSGYVQETLPLESLESGKFVCRSLADLLNTNEEKNEKKNNI